MELNAKNQAQKQYLNSIRTKTITFGVGCAGTGKTFIAGWYAADLFAKRDIGRVIVTRPIVEAGEELGFLPGTLEEKVDPYFVPVREAMIRRIGRGAFDYAIKAKQIEFVPLALMRGSSYDDTFLIADEMQNCSPKQMKMLLTRIGERTKFIVNGDLAQSDIPGPNGLTDALDRFDGTPGIEVCRFTRADVVRSGMAQVIVDGYEGPGVGKLPKSF